MQRACRKLGIPQPVGILLLAGLSCPFPGNPYWDAMVAFYSRYCHADADCLRGLLRRYKPLPGSAHAALAPAEMRALQDGDGDFMMRPLVHWQAIHGADDVALGAFLGLAPRRLGLLAYSRRPDPGSASYGDDLRFLARQCGCAAGQMATLLAN